MIKNLSKILDHKKLLEFLFLNNVIPVHEIEEADGDGDTEDKACKEQIADAVLVDEINESHLNHGLFSDKLDDDTTKHHRHEYCLDHPDNNKH